MSTENILRYFIDCLNKEALLEFTVKKDNRSIFICDQSLGATTQEFFFSSQTFIEVPESEELKAFMEYKYHYHRQEKSYLVIEHIEKRIPYHEILVPLYVLAIEIDCTDGICTISKADYEPTFNFTLISSGYSPHEKLQTLEEICEVEDWHERILAFRSRMGADEQINITQTPFIFLGNLFNTAAISVIRELEWMSSMHLESIGKTAAAYLFGFAPQIADDPIYNRYIEAFRMNSYQRSAVEFALSNPFTVITGPPGTGKSQVVLNLLTNIDLNGKTVLFASKNNKAVNVVTEKLFGITKPYCCFIRLGNRKEKAIGLESILAGIGHVAKCEPENGASLDAAFRMFKEAEDNLRKAEGRIGDYCCKSYAYFEALSKFSALERECLDTQQFKLISGKLLEDCRRLENQIKTSIAEREHNLIKLRERHQYLNKSERNLKDLEKQIPPDLVGSLPSTAISDVTIVSKFLVRINAALQERENNRQALSSLKLRLISLQKEFEMNLQRLPTAISDSIENCPPISETSAQEIRDDIYMVLAEVAKNEDNLAKSKDERRGLQREIEDSLSKFPPTLREAIKSSSLSFSIGEEKLQRIRALKGLLETATERRRQIRFEIEELEAERNNRQTKISANTKKLEIIEASAENSNLTKALNAACVGNIPEIGVNVTDLFKLKRTVADFVRGKRSFLQRIINFLNSGYLVKKHRKAVADQVAYLPQLVKAQIEPALQGAAPPKLIKILDTIELVWSFIQARKEIQECLRGVHENDDQIKRRNEESANLGKSEYPSELAELLAAVPKEILDYYKDKIIEKDGLDRACQLLIALDPTLSEIETIDRLSRRLVDLDKEIRRYLEEQKQNPWVSFMERHQKAIDAFPSSVRLYLLSLLSQDDALTYRKMADKVVDIVRIINICHRRKKDFMECRERIIKIEEKISIESARSLLDEIQNYLTQLPKSLRAFFLKMIDPQVITTYVDTCKKFVDIVPINNSILETKRSIKEINAEIAKLNEHVEMKAFLYLFSKADEYLNNFSDGLKHHFLSKLSGSTLHGYLATLASVLEFLGRVEDMKAKEETLQMAISLLSNISVSEMENENDNSAFELNSASVKVYKEVLRNRIDGKEPAFEQTVKDYFKSWKDSILRALFADLIQYSGIVVTTNLSARFNVPNDPALFDYVVIDEASQSDIASAIPLLFRAKRAVIIGDPNQLRHITHINSKDIEEFANKNGIGDDLINYDYAKNSLYDVSQRRFVELCSKSPFFLRNHYRCHRSIIEFSNSKFYKSELLPTAYLKADTSPLTHGISWQHVPGKYAEKTNVHEANEILSFVMDLMRGGLREEIKVGVITPFVNQKLLLTRLFVENKLISRQKSDQFLVSTVHSFQGDEKDIIIYSPVIAQGINSATLSWVNRSSNLLNVALTRAKSALVIFGDSSFCNDSGSLHGELYAYCREISTVVEPTRFESETEGFLYDKLREAGVPFEYQAVIGKYRTDFLFKIGEGFLCLELDGKQHYGARRSYDYTRDKELKRLGYQIIRYPNDYIREHWQTVLGILMNLVYEHELADFRAGTPDFVSKMNVSKIGQSGSAKSKALIHGKRLDLKQIELDEEGKEIFDTLTQWRDDIAEEQELPAYSVLSNGALIHIAYAKPRSIDSLSEIQGIGPKEVEKYGEDIVGLISEFWPQEPESDEPACEEDDAPV